MRAQPREPGSRTVPGSLQHRNPVSWMPLVSVLENVASLVNSQIEYLLTAWYPDAKLPNFIANGCITKTGDGLVEYNLGSEVKVVDPVTLMKIPEEELKVIMKQARKKTKQRESKRACPVTPNKTPRRRKRNRVETSTPNKPK